MDDTGGIDPTAAPSGPGCVECTAAGQWWFHLRRCAQCGHVGCCDDSLGRHGTKHYEATGHPYMQSFEPGEDWFYDFRDQGTYDGPELAAPTSHPVDQPTPGPAGAVPTDWEQQLS